MVKVHRITTARDGDPDTILGDGGQVKEQGLETVDGFAIGGALGLCFPLRLGRALGRCHHRSSLSLCLIRLLVVEEDRARARRRCHST